MNFLVSKISRDRLDKLISVHATDAKTLEVGSWGNPEYGKYFSNKVGIDIKEGKGVDVVASVYELPFKDGEFDTVLCMSVLEHLEDPSRAVKEMRRVLKTGGRIIISVPFMFPIHDAPGDYWRFTKYGLKYIFREGWEIKELKAETTTQESIAVFLQRLGYQTKMKLNSVSKFMIFSSARVIEKMPNLFSKVFGNINKTYEEKEAFASAFFMVAKKI